jgi:hypothetical protein
VKRALLVVAAGLIGILLGIGLSFAADAIAGDDLSDPVPLGVVTDVGRTPSPSETAEHDRQTPSPTPGRHEDADDHHGGSTGGGSGTQTPEPTETHASQTESPSSHEDGTSDDSSGGSESSDGDDD